MTVEFLTLKRIPEEWNDTLHNLLNNLAPLKTRSFTFTRSPEEEWNDGLHKLFNNSPLKTRSVTFTHSCTSSLRLLKAKGQQLEVLDQKTDLIVHKQMHFCHISHYKDCVIQATSTYPPLTKLIQM